MINIDSNDFALLAKNVVPGSRPVQPVGTRDLYFNDVEQLPGGPMPHDGKTYMRCKRAGKKNPVKEIKPAGLKDNKESKPNPVVRWITKQYEMNSIMEILTVIIQIVAFGYGAYYAWQYRDDTRGLVTMRLGQKAAAWLRSVFGFSNAYTGPVATSSGVVV
jgi:hypothetical protein